MLNPSLPAPGRSGPPLWPDRPNTWMALARRGPHCQRPDRRSRGRQAQKLLCRDVTKDDCVARTAPERRVLGI